MPRPAWRVSASWPSGWSATIPRPRQPAGRLEECFTNQPAGRAANAGALPGTTNIIESPHAGVRIQTRRVTHWQNGKMVIRWLASAFIRTEKKFNKIMGYRDLWTLEAILSEAQPAAGRLQLVSSTQPLHSTFNYARDMLQLRRRVSETPRRGHGVESGTLPLFTDSFGCLHNTQGHEATNG